MKYFRFLLMLGLLCSFSSAVFAQGYLPAPPPPDYGWQAPPPPAYEVQNPAPPSPGYAPQATKAVTTSMPPTNRQPYVNYSPPSAHTVRTPELQPFATLPPPPDVPMSFQPRPRRRHEPAPRQDQPASRQEQPAPKPAEPDDGRSVMNPELAQLLERLMRSLYTIRTLINNPENDIELRRVYDTGKISAEILGLMRYPSKSRFVATSRNLVIRDKTDGSIEYRHYGNFDNRVHGTLKPIGSGVFVDLNFLGRGCRRTHVRAQLTSRGTLDGVFYAYGWDRYGHPWKLQGELENVFTRDSGLPSGGTVTIYGADPTGRANQLKIEFPVRVGGQERYMPTDIRHRKGQPVSIGN